MILLLLGQPLGAQVLGNNRVSSTLSHDKIGLDETATLSVVVKGVNDVMDVNPPTVRPSTGLQIVPVGRQVSMTSINGVTTTATQFNFLLTPLEKGRYVIDPVTVTVNGLTHETTSHRIEVTDVMSRSSSNSTNPYNPWSRYNTTPPAMDALDPFNRPRGKDFILESELEPETVYKNQPTVYNLRLLAAARLMRDPRYAPILPTGLVSVPFPQENSHQQRDGRNYSVTEARTAFFPMTEGEYEFPASEVLLSAGIFGRDQTLATKPHVLKVLPLPREDQPASFTGAVGEYFELSASLDKTRVSAGETVELRVATYSEEGNLELVPYPYLPDWQGVEKKQAEGSSKVEADNGSITSRRKYVFRLRMKEPGHYDLSGIALAYFRPSEERYEVLRAPDLTMEVLPGKATQGPESTLPEQSELPEDEAPEKEEGSRTSSAGRVETVHLLSLSGIALLGLLVGLLKPGFKGPKLSWNPTHRPKDLSGLEKALSALAPGADRLAREEQLSQKGWGSAEIIDFERLKSAVAALRYGDSGREEAKVGDLLESFQSLLRRAGK